jgi:pteridine reductase
VAIHHRGCADEARALAADLERARPRSTLLLQADLAEFDRLPELVAQCVGRFGRLDALVNNASTWQSTPLSELRPAQFDELIAANLRAPLFLAQACAPLMAEGGCIVNLLDVHARGRPVAGFSAYLASKGALWTVTEALALELAPRLRVVGVAPGLMSAEQAQFTPAQMASETRRIPMARPGSEADVAQAVRFLLSPGAGYLNGTVIAVDGGLRLG